MTKITSLIRSQNKLYDELYQVFGDSDRPADENDLDRLPYLEQVLKETLRRFPVALVVLREAEEDVKLSTKNVFQTEELQTNTNVVSIEYLMFSIYRRSSYSSGHYSDVIGVRYAF